MGYWGYRATESDSALDYMSKITEQLEKLWDEAKDYGEKMAVVYILTEAPEVDMVDYRGLKSKAATYVSDYAAMLEDRNIDEMNASAQLRELVVADVVGGQYQCAECFPDGCRGRRLCQVDNATWREKERYASDVWDQPVSRIDLVHEIAKAAGEEGS